MISSHFKSFANYNLTIHHIMNMLWRPLNLTAGMKNFDLVMNKHRTAASSCSFMTKLWVFSSEFLFKDFPGTIDQKEQECIGVLVLIDGFIRNTKRSWKAHAEMNGEMGLEPESFETFLDNTDLNFGKL